MDEIKPTNTELPQSVYMPSEIIGIFNTILAQQSVNAKVVYLRGIYLASARQSYGGTFYDTLRDENGQEEITLRLSQQQRDNLKNGNLVSVGGILNRSISNKGLIQINLNVSRIEIMQEQVLDEAEIKRMELRQKKASIGFKNVDSILEQLLYVDQRPKIALVLAQSSITMSDFQAGINAAKSAIDFVEHRCNFANPNDVVNTIQQLDTQQYTAIALVRGGGSGIEHLDDVSVLESIVSLKTPIIGAIGHVDERLFIKQIVDKCAPTPNGLGQYFSEIVETVNEKKTRSRAALTEQIKKQFQEQLEAGQKQNKELQEKLNDLTKAQAQAATLHNNQVENANKQNQALQEQLKAIQEEQKNQVDSFNKSLLQMQDTNNALQKKFETISSKNSEYVRQLSEANEKSKYLEKQLSYAQGHGDNYLWKAIAIIAIIISMILLMYI
jgi:exonuclease VII large subunit